MSVMQPKKDVNHLPKSLETKRAYSNTPNEIKESCFQEIVESVYGGGADILSLLISNASTSELQQMYEIIKQQNTRYEERIKSIAINKDKNKNKISKIDEAENKSIKPKITSLSQISRDSVVHICGYLNRADIATFKSTSFRNGIVCLNEMAKCNIGIFNTNEVIDDKNKKYVDWLSAFDKKCCKYSRYPANMSVLTFCQMLQQQYGIPVSKQMLYSHNGKWLDRNTYNSSVRELSIHEIILFDIRNIVTLNEQNKPKRWGYLRKFNLKFIFIDWFDIYFQEIITIQVIAANPEQLTMGRVMQYIESEFIATTSKQKAWRSKVMSYFKQMNDIAPHHQKLIAFEKTSNGFSALTNPIQELETADCLFQLNTAHPMFTKCRFITIQEKFNLLK